MDYVTFNNICFSFTLFFFKFFSYIIRNIYFFLLFYVDFRPANLLVLAVIFIVLFDMSLVLAR